VRTSKRATIKEVARVAGVSTQTVSRVVNKRPDVSPDTRERVQQVIDQLDYQPSALARSLIQQRSMTLGVVTAGLKYMGPSRTLNGIASRASELGYALLLEELPRFSTEEIKPLLQGLLARHVDGIVWAAPEVGDNHRWVDALVEDMPVPVIFLTMAPQPQITTISIDNYAGAALAVRHLIERGRRRIGHISGPLDWWEARERKKAWQDTLAGAGHPAGEDFCRQGNWSSASGELAFEELLAANPDLDAVFAGNDQMALSVLRVAHRLGKRVPAELAVVGFDNLDESPYFWPALTTIGQDQHELGCRSVEEVVQQIEAERGGKHIEPRGIMLEPRLIVRESSE
jgi:DNA-binding LacI/PurR family transcriptional regulator